MNSFTANQENRKLSAYYFPYNISNFIPNFPQHQVDSISEQNIHFMLSKTQLRFRQGQIRNSYSLIFSELLNNPLHEKILLSFARRPVDTFCCWDSQLTQNLLKLFNQAAWTFRKMQLYSCRLGNQTSLLALKLDALTHLVIHSDPIGNQGIKNLMKGRYPHLETLIIGNTNITSDCIKLLKKNLTLKLTECGFSKQRHFNHDLFLRQSGHFINMQTSASLTYRFESEMRDEQLFYLYLGYVAKFERDFKRKPMMIFRRNENELLDDLNSERFLGSKTAIDNIKEIVDLSYQ